MCGVNDYLQTWNGIKKICDDSVAYIQLSGFKRIFSKALLHF